MKNALVILAGGKGKRFAQKVPKQFYKIGNDTIINLFLSNLNTDPFNLIVISISSKYRNIIKNTAFYQLTKSKIIFSQPGKTRQESSYNSLKKISNNNIKNVLIHDAARPFCTNLLIKKILKNLINRSNCIPFIEHNERKINKSNKEDLDVINIQTPQGFSYRKILEAHKEFKNNNFPDDAILFQKMNIKINFIKGEKTNVKLTYPEDMIYFNIFRKPIFRSGIGYDIHRIDINSKKGLKLCGIKIPFSKLIGHSDADVGLHAICDSIFGALSMRDIGYYFPDNNQKWKNADSSKFLKFCREKLIEKRFHIINLDINIIAEKPKINKYVVPMKKRISELLKVNINKISIKATTNEKIGFIGKGHGIAAEAIVQISNEDIY